MLARTAFRSAADGGSGRRRRRKRAGHGWQMHPAPSAMRGAFAAAVFGKRGVGVDAGELRRRVPQR